MAGSLGSSPLSGAFFTKRFQSASQPSVLSVTTLLYTVLAVLVVVLDAVYGADRVYADLPWRRRSLDDWYAGPGAALHHRPDLVVRNYNGAGTTLVLDVKTFDVCCATHLQTHHPDQQRLACHRALERHCRANEYKVSNDTPLPPRTRLVVFALSVFGSLGSEAAAFVHWLHKRQSGKLPPTLLEAASWACPQLGPFVRQAVGVAVRRGLAHAVNATHVHVPPPPPPVAPVAVRPRLTPWMDAARAGGVVVRELQ